MPLTAIVLAAGRGSRLGSLTASRPKCLLPLGTETLLDRQLRLLRGAGAVNIVIVTGYRARDIAAHTVDCTGVTLRHNPHYRETRPISSLCAARDFLTGDTLILNGDTVFEGEVIDRLLSVENDFSIAVSQSRADTAHVPVQLDGERITNVGKHVPVEQADAESCCIARVRATGVELFARTVAACDIRGLQAGWSWPFLLLARSGTTVRAVGYDGPLIDINHPYDYLSALEFFHAAPGADG